MSQVSAKLRKGSTHYMHWCPGCEKAHAIYVSSPAKAVWTFDGNVDAPTFSPSVRKARMDTSEKNITEAQVAAAKKRVEDADNRVGMARERRPRNQRTQSMAEMKARARASEAWSEYYDLKKRYEAQEAKTDANEPSITKEEMDRQIQIAIKEMEKKGVSSEQIAQVVLNIQKVLGSKVRK